MANFKKIAMDSTGTSWLQVGREQIKTEELVGRDLTVVAFDLVPSYEQADDKKYYPQIDPDTGEVKTYAIAVFKEIPDRYAGLGAIFTGICKAWMADYNTTEEASKALSEEGGVQVRMEQSKTKDGRQITKVYIL